jgi:hypothetical protein
MVLTQVEIAPQFIVVAEETLPSLHLSTASAVLKKPLKRFYNGGEKSRALISTMINHGVGSIALQ